MNLKNLKSKSAFTLIEVLLYISLIGTISISLVSMFGSVIESQRKAQTIDEINTQAAQVLQIMTQNIQNSVSTTVTSSTLLTLVMPGPTTTLFQLSGSTLQIKEGAATAVNLTSNRVTVSGLTFTNVSRPTTKGAVRIQFTLNHVNLSGKNQFTYSQTFYATASVREN
jgi:type II secretory pathway pseudopilin PulG